jgi:UDP-GlcNAc:undecaprenyl-phosphate/decaprenyl-phosphate GlcNAc-1-phosphate transferase
MITYLATFLVSTSIAAALTPVSRWFSFKVGAVDQPDARKVHRKQMPRMGGLAIVVAFLLPVAGLIVFQSSASAKLSENLFRLMALFGGGLIIACLGAADDIKGLRARDKFVIQFLVAIAAWFAGFRFDHIGLPFIGPVDLPIWIDLPLTAVWIVGVINAINLIDGLDGLAAGVTFFVAATNLVLSINAGNELGALFAATLAGAVIGFLLFNWNPAIVFMGDTGSMFIGFILATTSIMTSQKVSTAVAMVVPIVALGVPVIDTLMSMVRRFLEKRPLFSPDKGHLHHRLLKAGLTQGRAVLVIYALCIVFAIAAIAMTAARDLEAAVVIGVLAVVVVGIVRFFGFFAFAHGIKGALTRSKLVESFRHWLPEFSAKTNRETSSIDDVWNELVTLGKNCGFRAISWRTAGINPPDERSADLMVKGDAGYKKAARKGFRKAKTSAQIEPTSYIEIRFSYPIYYGKVTTEADNVLQVVGDTVGAALGRLRMSGKWGGSTPHPVPSAPTSSSGGEVDEIEKKEQELESAPSSKMSQTREGIKPSPTDIETPTEPAVVRTPHPPPTAAASAVAAVPLGAPSRGEVGQIERHIEVVADEDRHNPLLNDVWDKLIKMCREGGFVGAAWKTMGVKPAEERKETFESADGDGRNILKRSVPITSLSFVEVQFIYTGKHGKKMPPELKSSAKVISKMIGKELRDIKEKLVQE